MASADRLIEVFNEAKARPAGAERDLFLAEACRDEPALKEQVLSLLQAHEGAGDFLKNTQAIPPVTVLTEKPGDKIGRYKLLQKIGEGGCGVVYMAEQEEPVRRRVAFKVIKLGMDTKQVVARFEAEGQALALMDHPNIAKVFDAGATNTGRPYFVMELVRGIKITEYCDQNNLPTDERLKLFTQVCHAIQHAHQKGIIHRDIKPSNILVTVNDGVPVPKVIDFGIAKAIEQRLTDKTVFTAFEQFIGTPAYMSPEQAEMTSMDIDTRADIYSLGVLLYELLSGNTPFDAEKLVASGVAEIRRIIREQEPPKPSTRLNTLNRADLGTVALHRHTDPPKLMHLIRGDLDWIVMKCLEKDRTRRYETANGLAMDLQRHLDNEPVVARPPTNLYRFQKLVRRNKLGFAASAAVLLVLLVGIAASTWQAIRATGAEREQTRLREQAENARNNEARERAKAEANEKRAESEAAKSQQVAQFLKDMLKGVGPSVALGRDTTMLREILDRTAERIGKDLTNQPEVEVELRAILTLTYEELWLFKQREEMARETLRVSRSRLGEEHPAVADALHQIGDARSRLGDQTEAETFMREAVALKRKVLGNEHPSTAASLNVLAWVIKRQGKLTEAEMLGREVLALRRKLFGNEHSAVANSLELLGEVLKMQGKLAEAETLFRDALVMYSKVLGDEHPVVAELLNNLGDVLRGASKSAESESLYCQALARRRKLFSYDHPEVTESFRNLTSVLQSQGKLAEAETLYREELAARRRLLGNDHPDVARTLDELATVLSSQGKLAEAETLYREALAIRKRPGNENSDTIESLISLVWELHLQGKPAETEARDGLTLARKVFSNEHPMVGTALERLGTALSDQGKHAEAEAMFRDAVGLRRKVLGDHADTAHSLAWLAGALEAQGKIPAAEAATRESLEIRKKLPGNESWVVGSLDYLATLLQKQGKPAEAETVLRELLAMRRKLPADDLQLAATLAALTRTLLVEQKFAEAEPPARECLTIREKKLPDDWLTFNARSMLGGSLLGQKKFAEAEPLLVSAYEGMKQREDRIPANRKLRVKESLQRLVQLYEATGESEKAAEWNKKLAEFDKAEAEKKTAAPKP